MFHQVCVHIKWGGDHSRQQCRCQQKFIQVEERCCQQSQVSTNPITGSFTPLFMLSYASQHSFSYLSDLREVEQPNTCCSWPESLFVKQSFSHWKMTDLQISSWYLVLKHFEQRCSDELLVECQQAVYVFRQVNKWTVLIQRYLFIPPETAYFISLCWLLSMLGICVLCHSVP